jgi:uncharacterized sporulation protein YeaH/YhbH (DUF444 family)
MSISKRIIDRRVNPKGKSTNNRHRFFKRAKEAIRESIKEKIQDRKIGNTSDGENVYIPNEGIKEPTFEHDYNSGVKRDVRPGNKNFQKGDKINKPQKGGGKGTGKGKGSDDDDISEDNFEFALSKKEFYDIFFEDLELPNLKDKVMEEIKRYKSIREGFRKDGAMANLDKLQSYKRSLGRRMALKRPPKKKLQELENELGLADCEDEKQRILDEILKLKKKFRQIPFFDDNDMVFRNFTQKPQPNSKAVMFCILDVSASMGEHEKDLAKRFFMLLYMFLERKYEQTDIIFIRHHTKAFECDEEEFFHSKETGGTVVSSAIQLLNEIQKDRYPVDQWNVYVAQCSDGDNFSAGDSKECISIIQNEILPSCQYYAYIQTEYHRTSHDSLYFNSDYGLWPHYDTLKQNNRHFEMKQVSETPDIWKVFVELFKKQNV